MANTSKVMSSSYLLNKISAGGLIKLGGVREEFYCMFRAILQPSDAMIDQFVGRIFRLRGHAENIYLSDINAQFDAV
jgi:hypothetical protein